MSAPDEHLAEANAKVQAAFEAGLRGTTPAQLALGEARQVAQLLRRLIRKADEAGASKASIVRATGLSHHAVTEALAPPPEGIERIKTEGAERIKVESIDRIPPATKIVRRGAS